jgi:hypothetical protein
MSKYNHHELKLPTVLSALQTLCISFAKKIYDCDIYREVYCLRQLEIKPVKSIILFQILAVLAGNSNLYIVSVDQIGNRRKGYIW